jgi:spermidine synthase
MDGPTLKRIKSTSDFHEIDKDLGIERTYPYYTNGSLHFHTARQNIDILESKVWGKMLFLDGTLQSTTRDEIIYHNCLVHPLLDSIPNKKSVLILGGGEGATAREVLRWFDVDSVVMVDYDQEFVEKMKTDYGYSWSRGCFNDFRLKCIYEDAWDYMALGFSYDAVIIDLTDPNLNREKWYELLDMTMKSVSKKKGGFVMNAGLYLPWKTDSIYTLKNIVERLCEKNPGYKYYIYTTMIPSFNGEWTFIAVSHVTDNKFMMDPAHLDLIPEWIRRGTRTLANNLIDDSVDTVGTPHKKIYSPRSV